jgi:hypothetical protein
VVRIGAPAVHGTRTQDDNDDFGENLAKQLGNAPGLVADVIARVDGDINSRAQWTQQYTKALDLLGTRIEEQPQGAGQRRNVSRIGHPLIPEAMVKSWASSVGEMLPAAGPVKVPTIGRADADEEKRAKALSMPMVTGRRACAAKLRQSA